ncbi:MAG: hypothetical protein VX438_16295 [Planctomycetota bacterium]|nr:hypothetical protein [Planctomycetota bacterium]
MFNPSISTKFTFFSFFFLANFSPTWSQEKLGVRFSQGTTQQWEMGIEITSRGTANGITAIFPVPIDWPEQKVKVLEANKTTNVSKVLTRFIPHEE